MPRRARRKGKAAPVGRASRRPRAVMARSGFDSGAAMHRNLLLDPCNAPLGPPVYSGLGSGQYRRVRTIITAEGSSVEGAYVFQLGTNTFWKASHVAGTAGTNYTYSSPDAIYLASQLIPTTLDSVTNQTIRCIAGCVKVRYVGTEANRSGTIGLLACPAAYNYPGRNSTADRDATACPVLHRTGEVMHEVKFVPNGSDEEFLSPTQATPGVVNNITPRNSTLVAVYQGVPAQTIRFEVTAVYEVETAGTSGVITSVNPPSGMTLNQLLRSLGPVSQWAYSNVVAPTLRAMAGKASNTKFSSVVAVSRAIAGLAL